MKKLIILWMLSLIIICSGPRVSFAYRPFTTEDAGVAGKGVLQTEISWDYFKWKNGDSDQVFLLVSPIYGPSERLELSIETPWIIHHRATGGSEEGIGDINLVGKYVLLWDNYEKKDALFTMKGIVKLDTGSFEKGLGRGDMEYSLIPVFSKVINPYLTVHAQFGHTWVVERENKNLRNYILWGIAADYAITEPFHLVAEFNRNMHPDPTQPDQKIGLLGVTWEISKHITVDASYKRGFSDSSPKWGFGFGAALEF